MFGGLDICSLEAVVAKDDSEHIIEVNDCAMKLMGDTADEDRELIAQLVLQRMEVSILDKQTNSNTHLIFSNNVFRHNVLLMLKWKMVSWKVIQMTWIALEQE